MPKEKDDDYDYDYYYYYDDDDYYYYYSLWNTCDQFAIVSAGSEER
jgi:hypothetical protein